MNRHIVEGTDFNMVLAELADIGNRADWVYDIHVYETDTGFIGVIICDES